MDKQAILNSYLPVFSPVKGLVRAGEFDLEAWARFCWAASYHGANAMRILAYAPWSDDGQIPIEQLFCPYQLDPVQKAWDLDRWNDAYFVTLRRVVEVAEQYGIRLWLCLFDNCQFHHAHGGPLVSPWACNVQGARDYYHDRARSLAWADKVLALLFATRARSDRASRSRKRPPGSSPYLTSYSQPGSPSSASPSARCPRRPIWPAPGNPITRSTCRRRSCPR